MTSWGYVSQFPGTTFIARPDVDVLVAGETREWELVEYVQDMISSGEKKALIIMGHVVIWAASSKTFPSTLFPPPSRSGVPPNPWANYDHRATRIS